MKNCLLFALMQLFLFGCTSHEGYVLTANVPEGWEGKPVALMYADVNQPYCCDSAVIADGKFQFKGKFDFPRYCEVVIYLDPENRQDRNLIVSFPVFIDSTAIHVNCGYSGSKPDINIIGGNTQSEFNNYSNRLAVIQKERDAIRSTYFQAYYNQSEESKDIFGLIGQITEKNNEIRDFQRQYVKEHPQSPISLYILRRLCERYSELTTEKMKGLFALLSPQVQESESGKAILEMVRDKRIVVGKNFPDAELTAADGTIRKLSDFVIPGHYTLIEFWASWCSPCRAEIPYIKRAYEKYHPKGFNIVSISIDRDAEAWKKALEDEKLPWAQLLDNSRAVFAAYETSAVPTSLLIDEQGRIFRLDARGGWLDLALEEIYN